MNNKRTTSNKRWILRDETIAILLACLTAILLVVTASDIGLTIDEPAYIAGAHSYAGWFYILFKDPPRALETSTIDYYWKVNHEHPPVDKIYSGLIWLAARHIFDELTASRLGNILLVALMIGILYMMLARTYGKPAGLFAAAGILCLPRFFFHAHLAALDIPIAVSSLLMTWLFWKTVDQKNWAWGLLWGIGWGLTVATKLNGVFILVALVPWFLFFRRKWSVALRLILMGVFAVFTFFLVWPWLYYQTWERVQEYINFHLHHYGIGQWYLGQFFMPPPWHFVFVIIWAVVPLSVMILSFFGMARAGRGAHDGGFAWLMILSVVASISPFMFGVNLLYDNERLLMPVFPFLVALAGIGFGWLVHLLKKLVERIKRPALVMPVAVILGFAFLTPQSWTMLRLYPHLLSYYSEGVGGLQGATKLGFETTYWCEVFSDALPYINTHAESGEIIWSEDNDVLRYYQALGVLRQDVSFLDTNPPQNNINITDVESFKNVDWYIFDYRQSQYGEKGEAGYFPLAILKSQTPVYKLTFKDIPLMKVYGKLK
jgi:4-amino-4-deoxy-L-arabinose transferase-like glycosyltransferase